MKTVLVTGSDGFIGSHLVELLVMKGYKVRALVHYNSFNSWGWLDDFTDTRNIEVVSGDIRDANFCRQLTMDIDVVFHLAALIAIPYSYIAPSSYVETNVIGTLNLCQAARESNVDRLIHTSTSEVYGTAQYVPIDEKHPIQPQSPYSASKISADAIAMSFFHSFELPLTIARPFNTYGPRQSARAVIPAIITQISSGKARVELGDVTTTRDFNYVADTCRGLIALADCSEAIGKAVNIGSNSEISIADILQIIQDLMGSNAEFVEDKQRVRPRDSEVLRLCCDNSLIKSLVGFEPEVDIRAGLQSTIEWFAKPGNLHKYKVDLYNV